MRIATTQSESDRAERVSERSAATLEISFDQPKSFSISILICFINKYNDNDHIRNTQTHQTASAALNFVFVFFSLHRSIYFRVSFLRTAGRLYGGCSLFFRSFDRSCWLFACVIFSTLQQTKILKITREKSGHIASILLSINYVIK